MDVFSLVDGARIARKIYIMQFTRTIKMMENEHASPSGNKHRLRLMAFCLYVMCLQTLHGRHD